MGERFDRLRYEVFQNLFLSPMNTGSVRPAVATTPTARGIETFNLFNHLSNNSSVATTPTARGIETAQTKYTAKFRFRLQQHLPLAVLKRIDIVFFVYIKFKCCNNTYRSRY